MLKVTIAEVQRSVLKQLGMNFDGQWRVADTALRILSDDLIATLPVQVVVPGHGQYGDARLLDKTIGLFRAEQ